MREGKALRRLVPRSSQAVWRATRDRADIVEVLAQHDRGRLPELLPVRYARMAADPFGFLRGAAVVMALDLATGPNTGIVVQLVGDAHVGNFGLFATPERDQIFDADDFDETIGGPWEWDLKRLVTSLVVVGRFNGFARRDVCDAGRAALRVYRERIRDFAGMRYLDTWYSHLDLREATRDFGRQTRRLLGREVARAKTRTQGRAYPDLVRIAGGKVRIRDVPPLVRHFSDPREAEMYRDAFERYGSTLPPERRMLFERYRLVDVAQRAVGVGSVGTRCAVGLFLGDRDVLDPLFLQLKEAEPSVYQACGLRSPYRNHAERVVVGQRQVQEASDVLLGWTTADSRDFYVRQLRDRRFSPDVATLGPRRLSAQAELCGAALARAHGRTGDPAIIAGYI